MKFDSKHLFRSIILTVLVGIIPILSLWKNNLGQIQSSAAVKPLFFTIFLTIGIYGLFLLFSRSAQKSALFSLVAIIFVFSFGHVYNLLEQKPIWGISIGFLKLLVIYLVLFIVFVILISRIRLIPDFMVSFFNIIAAVLVVFNLFPILNYEIGLLRSQEKSQDNPPSAQAQDDKYPDIFYIVLDSYAREDILNDLIGYDNSSFLQSLRERGFYIPECAYSNYPTTEHVIESVLNYTYLESMRVYSGKNGEVSPEYTRMVTWNKARAFLGQFGYQFVTGRGFSVSLDIQDSDVYLNYSTAQGEKDVLDQNTFLSLYLNTTLYRVLTELFQANPQEFTRLSRWIPINLENNADLERASFWYSQNNYIFDSIEQISQKEGHYLIYAHIYSPHDPYVYTSSGAFRYRVPKDEQEEKLLYANAVAYLNQRVLKMVDELQKNADIQPVIIIQGDHSIHNLTRRLNKHKILNAYYLPGELNTKPYSTITPVNNFPLIIRNYFDPSMELLPDTLFVKWADSDEPVASSCDLVDKP